MSRQSQIHSSKTARQPRYPCYSQHCLPRPQCILVTDTFFAQVAAGNSNTDASSSSPARATAVNTIGATTIADARARFVHLIVES